MLKRGIKKWDLVLLTINCIIGAGIFGLPSKVFKLSDVYSIAAIFVCALAVLIFILCFAEVSTQFDKTGGPYIYTLEAFGRFPAFCMAWLLLLRGVFGYATLVNLLVIYLSFFIPWAVQPFARISIIFIVTAFLGYVNHIGVKNATRLNNVLTIAKLLPLIIFIVAGLFFLKPALLVPTAPVSFHSFSGSVLLFIFAFGGFEGVLINSGEIHDIKKTLPFALIASTLVVTIFYCLIQVVSVGILPNLAGSDKPLAEAAGLFLGKNGGYLMAVGAVLSILGTLNAGTLIGSRLPFALSEEDHFPKLFSYIHPKRLTPTWSLLFFLVSVAITSIFQSFLSALSMTVIIRVLSYLIICITLIKLRRNKKDKPEHFKLRFGYFFAITGILLSIWLLTTTSITEIKDVSVCLLVGLVGYAMMKLNRGFKELKYFSDKHTHSASSE